MARILITGAHGFIGKHLARFLDGVGHEVCGVGHGIWPESEARSCGVSHWINGDIGPGNLRLLQQRAGTPDLVFHLAGGSAVGPAIANPREDFFRTVATTAELLEWLRLDAPAARLVAVSSAAVYGAGHAGQIGEGASCSPYSPYGYHKYLMEQLCRSYASSYGLQVGVARLFSVFGPGLKKQLLWDLCSRLSAGATPLVLAGSGSELRDWTEVGDVVRALGLIGEAVSNQFSIVNVGTGCGTSVREIAGGVARHWANDGCLEMPLKFTGNSRIGDPHSLVADSSRLSAMGFQWHASLGQGLAAYVQWFREIEAARR